MKQEVLVIFERKTRHFLKNITSVGVESHLSHLALVTVCPSQIHKLTPAPAAAAVVVSLKTFALGAPECCDPDNLTPQRRVGRTKRNY